MEIESVVPEVHFYGPGDVADASFAFAVVAARHQGKWVFARHQDRNTWEIPGGHREPGEAIDETARRELYEETGATEFLLSPVCAYSATRENGTRFGMLYFAEVSALGPLPGLEIVEVLLADAMPGDLTYPLIQPRLFEKVREFLPV